MTPSDQYSSVRTVKQMAIEFLLNVQVAVCLFPYLARQNFCHPTVLSEPVVGSHSQTGLVFS